MHVAVSWDILAEGEEWNRINERLFSVFSNSYSWIKPLNTFYIVQVSSDVARTALSEALIAIGQIEGSAVRLLISPTMIGGAYSGLLPNDWWAAVNARTT